MVSSTNKTDRHDITEILLKVALNIITLILLKKLIASFMTKLMIKNIYEKKANDLQFPPVSNIVQKKTNKKNKQKNSYADGNQGTSSGNEAQKCSD